MQVQSDSSLPALMLCQQDKLTLNDGLPIRYIWMDKRVDSEENKSYLKVFRTVARVDPYSNETVLHDKVKAMRERERVRLIVSASLSDTVYEEIQKDQNIQSAMVFCKYRQRAAFLQLHYPRIKAACFNEDEVVETIKRWDQQQTHMFSFIEDKEISQLQRTTTNYATLVKTGMSSRGQSRDAFFGYLDKVLQDERQLLEAVTFQSLQIEEGLFLVEQVLLNSFFLREVNLFLKSTTDPLKLAYLHWPVYELFKQIQDQYLKSEYQGPTSYFSILTPSNQEKQRLKVGKHISILQFVKARALPQQANRNYGEIAVEIRIISHGDIASGFLGNKNEALFNIGNFYRIVSFDNRKLVLQLVTFTLNGELQQDDPLDSILLHILFTHKQQIYNYGQWSSLILGHKYSEAETYSKLISQSSKERLKWDLVRQKYLFRQGKPLKESLGVMNGLLKEVGSPKGELHILLTKAELLFLWGEDEEFIQVLRLILKRTTEMNVKEIQIYFKAKSELLKLAGNVIKSKNSPNQLKEVAEQIDVLQKDMRRDPLAVATFRYQLCLAVKVKCQQLLGNYRQQIQTLNRMLWLVGSTEGCDSDRFKKANDLKLKAYQRMNESEYQQDMVLKKKLAKSSVPLDHLLDMDSILKLNIGDMNFSIYS